MIRTACILLAGGLPIICGQWRLQYAPNGCWRGDWSKERAACCGPPADASCFDNVFTADVCCRQSPHPNKSCLPQPASDINLILALSTGLDTKLVSSASHIDTCRDLGWSILYVIFRVGVLATMMSTALASTAIQGVTIVPDSVKQRILSLPHDMRSMLLCVPVECSQPTRGALDLAMLVVERTLPVALRPAELIDPRVIMMKPFVEKRLQAPRDEHHGSKNLLRAPCQSGACAFLQGLEGNIIDDDAIVVLDVGAHRRSEFMNWLETDQGKRRWLFAFEPNPIYAGSHPDHPRLACIEAAIANPEQYGDYKALLHRSEFDQCNSLLPISSEAQTALKDSNLLTSQCLSPSNAGPVQVHIVSLRNVLSALPPRVEIALLKIDAEGTDLTVVESAGSQLYRVRRIQMEVSDLPSGDPRMPYGKSQPSKEDAVRELWSKGFMLDACVSNAAGRHFMQENCLFTRSDLVGSEIFVDDVVIGDVAWHRHEWYVVRGRGTVYTGKGPQAQG